MYKAIKCPNCGASLTVDSAHQRVICTYCDSTLVRDEDQLNGYTILVVEGDFVGGNNTTNIFVGGAYVPNGDMIVTQDSGRDIVGRQATPSYADKKAFERYKVNGIVYVARVYMDDSITIDGKAVDTDNPAHQEVLNRLRRDGLII